MTGLEEKYTEISYLTMNSIKCHTQEKFIYTVRQFLTKTDQLTVLVAMLTRVHIIQLRILVL